MDRSLEVATNPTSSFDGKSPLLMVHLFVVPSEAPEQAGIPSLVLALPKITLPTGTRWLGPGPEDGDGFGADDVGAVVVGADVVGADVVGADVVGADVVGADVVGELDGTSVGFDVVGEYEGVSLAVIDGGRLAAADGAWDAVIDG